MDFLKSFKEAQSMGLTKEEFIGIWKTEFDFKMAIQRKGHHSLETSEDVRQQSQRRASTTEISVQTQTRELCAEKEDENDIISLFQSMCKQLHENQEHHWQQLQRSLEEMLGEVRSRFEILTSHVSNIANCNTDSLKLHCMQELDLLKQELVRVVNEQTNRESCKLETSQQTANLVFGVSQTVSAVTESSSATVKNTEQGSQGNERSQIFSQQQQTGETRQPQNAAKEITASCESNTNDVKAGLESETTKAHNKEEGETVVDKRFFTDSHLNVNDKSLLNSITRDKGDDETKEFSSGSGNYEESVKKTETNPTEGIESCIYKDKNLSSSRISSNILLKSYSSPQELSEHDDQSLFLSQGGQEYTFAVGYGVGTITSPFMNSNGGLFKNRLSVKTEKTGRLVFRVFVSGSDLGGDHQWPKLISGTGFILHTGSKKYSPIWLLQPVLCQKPISDSTGFECSVCLITSRKKFPSIQYNQLVEKNFVDNGTITCKWTLHAREN